MSKPPEHRTESGEAVTDDLVVVSNRQPYRHQFDDDGSITVQRPVGGLTAGLDPVLQRLGGTWIAWGDGEADFQVTDRNDRVEVPPEDPSYTLQRVQLSEKELDEYYRGYANQALWPLCHVLTGNLRFDHEHWETYWSVNHRFAETTAELIDDDATVWFQDYHFGLAPGMLRDRTDALLLQFWHIPWPAPDVFQVCPTAHELLEGLLGNDLLGFHLPQYSQNFLDCVDRLVPEATVDKHSGHIRYGARTTRVQSFPMGVDAKGLHEKAVEAGGVADQFREDYGLSKRLPIVLGVDRLDYTKGIRERLAGLDHLWETRPELRGEFTYVQKGNESRSEIPAYRRLQEELHDAVDAINDRFGTDDWQPVVYTAEYLSQDRLCGLYRDADIALVTPVRDGMNLVSKEFVATQVDNDGVLVLSELAGAHDQLQEGTLTVNPYDEVDIASTVEQALRMDENTRRQRMRDLRAHVNNTDILWWIDSILGAAEVRSDRMKVLTS